MAASNLHGCIFVQYTAEYSGSPISGLTVVDVLRSRGMDVDAVFGVPGPLEQDYRARGCQIHHLPHGQWLVGGSRLRRLRRWGREAKATWAFVLLFRRLRPDLVYVNTLMSVAAVIAARVAGIPAIWHVRELFEDVGGEIRWPLGGRPLVRALVRRLPARIVCISQAVKNNVLGPTHCPKAQVIYNPLAESYFEHPWSASEARAKLGLPQDAFVVGLPGTLRPVKGHEFFIDAAAQLLEDDRTYRFAISGALDSAYARDMRGRCEDLGIVPYVNFVGAIADMRLFYAACNLVCVTSRAESFGRTVIEAFAQRRPVIATRAGGIPEIVTDGETGLLVDYGDEPALGSAIRRLQESPGLRHALAERALDFARERYHQTVFGDQLRDLVGKLRLASL
jgi:glycosyltransferase involved in cell wall biosynthesis